MIAVSAVTFSALVLFDIDGTLVRRAGPHHRNALVEGIRRVTGLDTTTEGIPVQGMLDPVILTLMLRRAGVAPRDIRLAMPEIQRAAERYYRRVCPEIRGKQCPAVEPVLDRLTRRGILLGLVTGNLTRIGWHKLGRAGLRPLLPFRSLRRNGRERAPAWPAWRSAKPAPADGLAAAFPSRWSATRPTT